MDNGSPYPDAGLHRLCSLMRLTIAVEEACLASLSDLIVTDDGLPNDDARRLVDCIHHHRVGLLKHRARAGALGIDL